MKVTATHRHRFAWLALLALVPLALVAGRANAQVDPAWDHYKVYDATPILLPPTGVFLRDQFGPYNHTVEQLEFFMNPTRKEVLPPNPGFFDYTNPDLHYAWWRITPQPFSGIVTAVNQFGDHTLNVFDALYLLNPARKNQPGPPPAGNHYKCYACQGSAVNREVILTDQFGQWGASVTVPRFFCNPVEKQLLDGTGTTYPMIDPNQHYVCYEFDPVDTTPRTATFTDQFVLDRAIELPQSRLLCVPTYKSGVTSTGRDTWGRIKLLYR